MVRSTDLVIWLKQKEKTTPAGEKFTAKFSKKALELYDALTFQGLFPEFLMTRQYKSGTAHLVKVR